MWFGPECYPGLRSGGRLPLAQRRGAPFLLGTPRERQGVSPHPTRGSIRTATASTSSELCTTLMSGPGWEPTDDRPLHRTVGLRRPTGSFCNGRPLRASEASS